MAKRIADVVPMDWVYAGNPTEELPEGERLRQLDGTTLRVVSVTRRPNPQDVYHLEVQVDHVYHVANSSVLVHNGNSCDELLTFYHGTDIRSAHRFLNRGALDAGEAVARSMGARPGFYLGTDFDAGLYFASLRDTSTALKFTITRGAYNDLISVSERELITTVDLSRG